MGYLIFIYLWIYQIAFFHFFPMYFCCLWLFDVIVGNHHLPLRRRYWSEPSLYVKCPQATSGLCWWAGVCVSSGLLSLGWHMKSGANQSTTTALFQYWGWKFVKSLHIRQPHPQSSYPAVHLWTLVARHLPLHKETESSSKKSNGPREGPNARAKLLAGLTEGRFLDPPGGWVDLCGGGGSQLWSP